MVIMVLLKKHVFLLHLISKIFNRYLYRNKKTLVDFSRRENKNFIEYMKVFNDTSGEFDTDKVANLIMKKWGKKVMPRSVADKKTNKH
jgi:hypothetical protein